MKYFIVVGLKKENLYLWDYSENEYYEFKTNESSPKFQVEDVIELDTKSYVISRISSLIEFNIANSRIIGKTNLNLLMKKMNIVVGRQTISFEDLLNQRNDNRRIISLVKFTGSKIKNNQLRIKHKKYFSYCDIRDNRLKNREGQEYKGTALVEYIPNRKKERSYNLILSVGDSFKNTRKSDSVSQKPHLIIDLEDEELNRLFSSNKKHYKEIDKEREEYVLFQEGQIETQEEIDKKIEEQFFLMPYVNYVERDSFYDYFGNEILEDSVNDGFNDWGLPHSECSLDLYDELDFKINLYTEIGDCTIHNPQEDWIDSLVEDSILNANKDAENYFEEINDYSQLIAVETTPSDSILNFNNYNHYLEFAVNASTTTKKTECFSIEDLNELLLLDYLGNLNLSDDNLDNSSSYDNATEIKKTIDFEKNPVIQHLNMLLGKFKVFLENDIESKMFALNNDFITINYLHPYGKGYNSEDLPKIRALDPDILLKYFNDAELVLKQFHNFIPNISISNIKYNMSDEDESDVYF